MSGYALHLGDCLEVMRAMPDNSVDAIVTDPPYHLTTGKKGGNGPASANLNSPAGRARVNTGFMGQQWDGGDIAFRVELWAEALRVLKPGGHLLAFSGSRTYHRMACAIEDAGFEIRDQIMWVYSQGFPKGNNLDNLRGKKICGCATGALPYTHENTEPKTERGLHPVQHTDVPPPVDSGEGRGQVLQSGLPEQSAPVAGWAELPDAKDGRGESSLEGRGNDVQAQGQLQGHPVHSGVGLAAANGSEGRVHHGASGGNGAVVRLPADPNGGGTSHRPRPGKQPAQQSGTVADEQRAQAGGAWPICAGCDLPVVPSGLGTALKPSHEPICVARKPLIGTVAANVLAHGTGALNIDACRVPFNGQADEEESKGKNRHADFGSGPPERAVFGQDHRDRGENGNYDPPGRWPANIIHDGSDEVLGAFPATNSVGHAPAYDGGKGNLFKAQTGTGGMGERSNMVERHFDTGSAARFFYCAKASRHDRNEGCEQFDKRPLNWSAGTQNPGSFQAEGTDKSSQNFHPTVKPTDLMAYLVRLVTPPGGVVLDPFMGSGSTGKAAVREGFGFIGIEMNPDYLAIAEARLAHAQRSAAAAAPPPGPQADLFQELG